MPPRKTKAEVTTEVTTTGPLAVTFATTADDFPAELGTVSARVTKPDGAEVATTEEGRKYRREPGGEWLRAV